MVKTVVVLANAKPAAFVWKGRNSFVEETSDHWRESGRWWEDEPPCELFLIQAEGRRFLLRRNLREDSWHVKPVH